MKAKEKSSSPAATAKGTAPSNYKYFSSLPPIFQVSDPQTKDEMKRGRAYDEGNQGEAYNPDYLWNNLKEKSSKSITGLMIQRTSGLFRWMVPIFRTRKYWAILPFRSSSFTGNCMDRAAWSSLEENQTKEEK